MRLGLSFTTAGSSLLRWPIGVPESTRSETRLSAFRPVESGFNVAAHPVAQLNNKLMPVLQPLQHSPRYLSARTLYFHTIYDGDGKRIKKYVPNTNEVTIFVY